MSGVTTESIVRELIRITTGHYPPVSEDGEVTLALLQSTPPLSDEITDLWKHVGVGQ